MNNLEKLVWVGVGVLAAVVIGFVSSFFGGGAVGGQSFAEKPSFMQGLYAGFLREFEVDNAGNASTSATLAVGTLKVDAGAGITEHGCATASWNPGSLASSSVDGVSATTTDIALTGAAMGDLCDASLTSATSSAAFLSCTVSDTATGTIRLLNMGTAALDIVTGTARVCYTAY